MSDIEEIKNRLNVLDVVGSYVKLTKTGVNYRGVCPFHSEKKPSFFVNPSRQIWHCFGCGAGFSIFDFIMKIEGIEFGDALRILAQKAGIELKREDHQLKTERQGLYEICEISCKFFEKQMEASAIGREAEDYLKKRGIKKESVRKWRLGYAPDAWQGLSDFLVSQGYLREEIIKAGLAVSKDQTFVSSSSSSSSSLRTLQSLNDLKAPQSLNGPSSSRGNESYDRFRGRIIFPVFDLNSQVVGFGGRVFKQQEETAKYINTPQTLLYDKSNIMYGLNNAKLQVRKQNHCVITEGYTDVIMAHQAGFENTVGASGTALTAQHLNILKRYTENLLLAFDMDVAGDSATKRGINAAQEQGFNIKIVESYMQDADPADIILKDPNIWQKALEQARSIMDYYFDSAFSHFDGKTPEGKKEIGKVILPAMYRLPNLIERSHWVQKLAEKLFVKEEVVMEELNKIKGDPNSRTHQNDPNKVIAQIVLTEEGRKKALEEKIISLILKDPNYVDLIEDSHYLFFSEKTRDFFKKLKEFISQKKFKEGTAEENLKIIFSDFPQFYAEDKEGFDTEVKNFLAALAFRADVQYQEDGKDEFLLCLLQLKNIELKKKLNAISEDIKKAETEKNSEQVNDLIEEFNKLTKEL